MSARAPFPANTLSIPGLGVSGAVVPIHLASSGNLAPPSDYREAGWWAGSAPVGSGVGQTLITAHTVHTGGGLFDGLGSLHSGDKVMVSTSQRQVTFVVNRVQSLSKAQLAQQSQDLFNPRTHPGRLVLVTCGGWTGSEYTANIVVFAQQVGIVALSAA